ncbi:DNA-binding response regulator, OmpR family, contains REC and winged-helix (wHTH) domain [Thiothrix eikelboomii]|uniref:DNA-binding response regulator, OmpR family, contains REC and winged-helix (WHTH) domain n=2 Tax=Thiothrix eikelboomii TaxID=92487 RepID=A0A1T4W5C9_9GAMM|nr:DNA-binding response regulator, OmpR family, contains REC and winged-helix (wHTH) domain [Thiothrix eikelboomii]
MVHRRSSGGIMPGLCSVPEIKVAVVDDDAITRFLLGSALRENQMTVFECESAEALFTLLQHARLDVIILDLVLPQINGLDALSYLREQSAVGVIMISSRANAEQRLFGLREGADDFISKPVVTDELVFKVKSLALRVHHQQGYTSKQSSLALANCELLIEEQILARMDRTATCPLSEAEQRLLVLLVQQAPQACSRKSLLHCVSRSEISLGNDRSVDTLISRIRNKLRMLDCTASISAVRGQGYRLQLDDSVPI